MLKFFSSLALLLLTVSAYTQELSQVTFSGGGNFSYFSLLTDREVLIRISDEGKILEWGIEEESFRIKDYYARQLLPYLGRVEYYGQESDPASKGKVKSIGTATITYYESYETDYKIGKIRTIGPLLFDYYNNFDEKAFRGKIKFLGSLPLAYYSSFENEAFMGKLKSAGSTSITYYSSFDDKVIRGRIKSIGPVSYNWYTSLDIGRGGLKSGLYRQNIGGVTYILQ